MSLLAGPGPRLYGVPSGQTPFEPVSLAIREWAAGEAHPFALADVQVFVPNRRAGRVFLQQFAATGPAGLAPRVRVLGDLEAEPDDRPDAPGQTELPDALTEPERVGLLAALVAPLLRTQAELRGASAAAVRPAQAIEAARHLATLLDQAAMAGLEGFPPFETLVAGTELARHWQTSAQFLDVLRVAWPHYLAAVGRTDPAARRLALVSAQIAAWQAAPPSAPVIVAGSTGSAVWVQRLMSAVLALPQGAVILPGFAPLTPAEAADIAEADEASPWVAVAETPGHPLHVLARTLKALGRRRADVRPLPGLKAESAPAAARRRFVMEALAPAGQTADWRTRLARLAGPQGPRSFAEAALSGVTRLDVASSTEEITLAALLLREALADPAKTALLVCPDPDRTLAVARALGRFGLEVTPSAGLPLATTEPGQLALTLNRALDKGFGSADAAVHLAGLMRLSPALYADLPDALSTIATDHLRGAIRWRTPAELAAQLDTDGLDPTPIVALAQALERFHITAAPTTAMAWGSAWAELYAFLAGGPERAWAGEAGARLATCLETAVAELAELAPLEVDDLTGALDRAVLASRVPPPGPGHPRLALLGPLEARVQRADRVVLIGLSEGTWPAPPPVDPFLPRSLRAAVGLPDPDERLGLAAHDFAHLMAAPEVFLIHAARDGDTPTVASRWLWRLETLARAAGSRLSHHHPALDWLAGLDRTATPEPASPPEPRPAVGRRPRMLGASQVRQLIRDPYAIYAAKVLGLRPLEAVGDPLTPARRGQAIHAAIEGLRDGVLPDVAELAGRLAGALRHAGADTGELALQRGALQLTAEGLRRWLADRARAAPGAQVMPEIDGKLHFPRSAYPGLTAEITLRARADRIERLADGTAALFDFKTGQPPSKKQMLALIEPQLPLMAGMLEAGAFEGVPPCPVACLGGVPVKASAAAGKLPPTVTPDEEGWDRLPARALEHFVALMIRFDQQTQPYRSRVMPFKQSDVGDYDALARLAEWFGEADFEAPDAEGEDA